MQHEGNVAIPTLLPVPPFYLVQPEYSLYQWSLLGYVEATKVRRTMTVMPEAFSQFQAQAKDVVACCLITGRSFALPLLASFIQQVYKMECSAFLQGEKAQTGQSGAQKYGALGVII